MQIHQTDLAGLLLIEPKIFGDSRGFFFESYQRNRYHEAGLRLEFVQDNLSRSAFGTVRGLHYQLRKPQGKLVQVVRGTVFDVAVDLRKSSPTFGRWQGFELSEPSAALYSAGIRPRLLRDRPRRGRLPLQMHRLLRSHR
jgi:dTDP-4-dehydrorhamnose 3,5-epimerase